jgi:cysteine desulfurase
MTLASTGRIYLDNAATTALDPEVLEAMLPHLRDHFGNPSSLYSYGREARLALETARKTVASLLRVRPSTLVFTSGGTESDNMAIAVALRDLGCTHILYPPTEHHAVLHPVEYYGKCQTVTSSLLQLGPEGVVNLGDLANQLSTQQALGRKCLVCIMHANNETGVMADLPAIGKIARAYDAVFFSDCVQTIGHYPLALGSLPVDLASASGHKFHGPRGTGLLYIREGLNAGPLLHGGGQERNLRSGTENVAAVVGFAKALEIAMRDYDRDSPRIRHLRFHLYREISQLASETRINGDLIRGLYTVLNLSFPKTERTADILLHLDQQSICVSGGSACSAGTGSHVMKALGRSDEVAVRFSFSKWNTSEDIDRAVSVIRQKLDLRNGDLGAVR